MGGVGNFHAWTGHTEKLASSRPEHACLDPLSDRYAREVAKRMPARARQVITIGTPFASAPGETATTSRIEVEGSHCGLGWNTAVFSVIADRLRQPQGAWQAYQR